MENICPICGFQVHEIYRDNNTTKRQLTKYAATAGGKIVAKKVGTATGAVVGSFFGAPTVGAALGGTAASFFAGNQIKSHFDNNIQNYKFKICQSCGLEWNASKFNNSRVLSIVEKVKLDNYKKNRDKSVNNLIWTVVFGLITFLCGFYCFTHNSSTKEIVDDWIFGPIETTNFNFLWYFLGLILIISAPLFLRYLIDTINTFIQSYKINKMSLLEYVQKNHIEICSKLE